MAHKLDEKYKVKIYIGVYHFTLKLSLLGFTNSGSVRESLVYLQTPHTHTHTHARARAHTHTGIDNRCSDYANHWTTQEAQHDTRYTKLLLLASVIKASVHKTVAEQRPRDNLGVGISLCSSDIKTKWPQHQSKIRLKEKCLSSEDRWLTKLWSMQYWSLKIFTYCTFYFEQQTNLIIVKTVLSSSTPYSLVKVNRYFEGTFHPQLHGRRISKARNKQEVGGIQVLHAISFLLICSNPVLHANVVEQLPTFLNS
jgi:hypothetical protein